MCVQQYNQVQRVAQTTEGERVARRVAQTMEAVARRVVQQGAQTMEEERVVQQGAQQGAQQYWEEEELRGVQQQAGRQEEEERSTIATLYPRHACTPQMKRMHTSSCALAWYVS